MKYNFTDQAQRYLNTYYGILDRMITKMSNARLVNSISYNFISQMLPHHRAAIEMSKNVLNYTKNRQLRNIASQIISEQTKSIENMLKIWNICEKFCNSNNELYEYQSKIDEIAGEMFYKMKNATATNRITCNFIREMIPHHMGAVSMSQTALNYKICPELIPILQAIITSQKRGISQMHRLAKQIGCEK